jgi:hypothetical protein
MRIAIAAAVVLACTVAAIGRTEPQLPRTFTNLQVLPKTITGAALVNMMKGFTSALGVRCEHCHEGGPDLATFNFASDSVPAKITARRMMQLTATIDGDLLKGIGDAARQPKVTCFTCHRGARTPLTAPAGNGL